MEPAMPGKHEEYDWHGGSMLRLRQRISDPDIAYAVGELDRLSRAAAKMRHMMIDLVKMRLSALMKELEPEAEEEEGTK